MANPTVGQLELTTFETNPNPVSPGSQLTVRLVIEENAEIVGPSDNLCNPDTPLQSQGISVEATVNAEFGGSRDRQMCVPVYAVASEGMVEPEFTFTAPELPQGVTEQSYQIAVTLVLTGSLDSVTTTTTVTVARDAPVQSCSTKSDCPPGYKCESGECVPETGSGNGGNGSLLNPQTPQQWIRFGVLGIGGILALQAISDVAETTGDLAEPESPETRADVLSGVSGGQLNSAGDDDEHEDET